MTSLEWKKGVGAETWNWEVLKPVWFTRAWSGYIIEIVLRGRNSSSRYRGKVLVRPPSILLPG